MAMATTAIDDTAKFGARAPRFTWERPEHADCAHTKIGDVVAIKPDGAKLAFCVSCNRLMVLKS